MTAQDIQTKALQRIRADVRAMQGYHVQPAQGLLKMDTMENPTVCRPSCSRSWASIWARSKSTAIPASARKCSSRCWPTTQAPFAGTSVLLGNGSDEIITLLALATAQPCNNARARCWLPCRVL